MRSFAMSHVLQTANPNRLLASLQPNDAARLAALCRTEHPPRGRILTSASQLASDVWFPQAGTVALITTDASGRSVQTGMVGREGCVGLEGLFGDRRPVSDAVVQIAGAMSVIPANHLKSMVDSLPRVQFAVSKFLFRQSAQSFQTIACNRLHSLHARCCRWLLTMQDKTTSDDLPVTQENLAILLGGGRPRVNLLLAELENEGILRRHRGRIHLLSRDRLERLACECYRLVRDDTVSIYDGLAQNPTVTAVTDI